MGYSWLLERRILCFWQCAKTWWSSSFLNDLLFQWSNETISLRISFVELKSFCGKILENLKSELKQRKSKYRKDLDGMRQVSSGNIYPKETTNKLHVAQFGSILAFVCNFPFDLLSRIRDFISRLVPNYFFANTLNTNSSQLVTHTQTEDVEKRIANVQIMPEQTFCSMK